MIKEEDIPRNAIDGAIYVLQHLLAHRDSFVLTSSSSFNTGRLADLFWCLQVAESAFEQINLLYKRRLSTILIKESVEENKVKSFIPNIADLLAKTRGLRLSDHFIGSDKDIETVFSLEADEIDRIFKLAGEMKELVHVSEKFDENHKLRLIKRISKIEFEIHRPKGSFDVILAGVTEVGETLGKFGKDVKPLVDRMQEIRKITQPRTENYPQIEPPEETKRLPSPEKDADD